MKKTLAFICFLSITLFGQNVWSDDAKGPLFEKEIIYEGNEQFSIYYKPKDVLAINDKLIIVDGFSPFIKLINVNNWEIEKEFCKKGKGPGELILPAKIRIDTSNNFVIYDLKKRSFNKYSIEGDYISSVVYPNIVFNFQIDLNNNYMIFNKQKIGKRTGITRLKVVVKTTKEVLPIDSLEIKDNIFLKKPFPVFVPIPYAGNLFFVVLTDGRIITLSSLDYKFNVFGKNYKKIREFNHSREQIKVTKKDENEFFDNLKFSNPFEEKITYGTPPSIRNKIDFPKYKDFASGLFYDKYSNMIIVKTNEVKNGKRSYDIFNSDLQFVRTIKLEKGIISSPVFDKYGFYQIEKNREEYFNLVKYKFR